VLHAAAEANVSEDSSRFAGGTLAAALLQHPQSSLRAMNAGLRHMALLEASKGDQEKDAYGGFNLLDLARTLPMLQWFVTSVTSAEFWSGAESAAAGQCTALGKQQQQQQQIERSLC
jgi:hypothetical protein